MTEILKQSFESAFKSSSNHKRFNIPHSKNKKAYISVSKQINKNLYEMTIDEIGALIYSEIDFLKRQVSTFADKLGVVCEEA